MILSDYYLTRPTMRTTCFLMISYLGCKNTVFLLFADKTNGLAIEKTSHA